jgi:hypothetical protein
MCRLQVVDGTDAGTATWLEREFGAGRVPGQPRVFVSKR